MEQELGPVQSAIKGDREALSQLLHEIGPVVRQRIAPRINKRWQALLSVDDVMQETYADAFLGIHAFQPEEGDPLSSLTRWLTTIARHNLLDAVKGLKTARSGGRFREVRKLSAEESYHNLLEQLSASATTPSRAARRMEAKSILEKAIDKLPGSYREVVLKYDIEGLAIDRVAAEAKCSQGAIFMRRARAHAMLKDLIGSSLPF